MAAAAAEPPGRVADADDQPVDETVPGSVDLRADLTGKPGRPASGTEVSRVVDESASPRPVDGRGGNPAFLALPARTDSGQPRPRPPGRGWFGGVSSTPRPRSPASCSARRRSAAISIPGPGIEMQVCADFLVFGSCGWAGLAGWCGGGCVAGGRVRGWWAVVAGYGGVGMAGASAGLWEAVRVWRRGRSVARSRSARTRVVPASGRDRRRPCAERPSYVAARASSAKRPLAETA
jgi:hypothetical protein